MADGDTSATGSDGDVYARAPSAGELRQGEIITGLQYFVPIFAEDGRVNLNRVTVPISIVVSQDCDLLRDYDAGLQNQQSNILNVLLYEVHDADRVNDRSVASSRDFKKKILQNNDERYHYLEEVPQSMDLENVGLRHLLIDFRRYYTLPSHEVYRQVRQSDGAKRRSMIMSPYREHLQSRLAFYLQRVSLPSPHRTPE